MHGLGFVDAVFFDTQHAISMRIQRALPDVAAKRAVNPMGTDGNVIPESVFYRAATPNTSTVRTLYGAVNIVFPRKSCKGLGAQHMVTNDGDGLLFVPSRHAVPACCRAKLASAPFNHEGIDREGSLTGRILTYGDGGATAFLSAYNGCTLWRAGFPSSPCFVIRRYFKRFSALWILTNTRNKHAQPPHVEEDSTGGGLRQASVEAGDSGATLAALTDDYIKKD